MKKIPRPLIVECCKAMAAREDNHGTFPNGIPDCMVRLRDEHYPFLDDDTTWLLVIEGVVSREAIRIVAEATA